MQKGALVVLLISSTALLGSCGYQDYERPLIRNYASDLFYSQERPPALIQAEVTSPEALAEALSRWRQITGPEREDYQVGQGDVLKVNLVASPEEKEASPGVDLVVDRAGEINCPLLGKVRVGGLSTPEIEEELARRYRDGYYRSPGVQVRVSEYRSKPVYVTGAVMKPGIVTLQANRTTLLEALLEAGGLSDNAGDTAVVTQVRFGGHNGKEGPAQETVSVNLGKLLKQSDFRQNVPIESGDIIYVPPRREEHFYVQGFVNAPGAYPLPKEGAIGLVDAVAYAHGLSEAARAQYTHLIRVTPAGMKQYHVDLTRIATGRDPDIIVQPDDRITVGTDWTRRTIDGVLHVLSLRSLAPTY